MNKYSQNEKNSWTQISLENRKKHNIFDENQMRNMIFENGIYSENVNVQHLIGNRPQNMFLTIFGGQYIT